MKLKRKIQKIKADKFKPVRGKCGACKHKLDKKSPTCFQCGEKVDRAK